MNYTINTPTPLQKICKDFCETLCILSDIMEQVGENKDRRYILDCIPYIANCNIREDMITKLMNISDYVKNEDGRIVDICYEEGNKILELYRAAKDRVRR